MRPRWSCLALAAVLEVASSIDAQDFQVDTLPAVSGVSSPAVAKDAAGRRLVVWNAYAGTNASVLGRFFAADGVPLGPQFNVANAPLLGSTYPPSPAMDAAGNTVVVWTAFLFDGSDLLDWVEMARYAPGGTFLGGGLVTPMTVNGVLGADVTWLADGSMIVVWASFNGIRGRHYAPDGTPNGPAVLLATVPAYCGRSPNVCADSVGGFVATWTDTCATPVDAIRGRHFASDGSALGPEFPVSGAFAPGDADLAADPSAGGLIATWGSQGSSGGDSSGSSVQARRFTPDGAPLGPEFQVNTYTNGDQGDPRVAAEADGTFVVAWESAGSFGTDSSYSIQARKFAADGSPLGLETQVNVQTAGAQFQPGIATDGSGHFMIVWRDLDHIWAALEGLPTSSISVGDVTVTEGDSGTVTAVFPVSLDPPAATDLTLSFATADGTAAAGADYVATSGTLTLAAGASTASIAVTVNGDVLDEIDEAFLVGVSGDATTAYGQGSGTITDDDPAPALSIADASAPEGSCSPSMAAFSVSLSAQSGQTVSVAYTAASGTATAGVDFEPVAGTLSIGAGATTADATVPIIDDFLDEPDETFTVTLSAPVAATLADGQAVGTVLDDDGPGPPLGRELGHGSVVWADLTSAPGPSADVDLYAIAARPRSSYEVVADALSGDVVPLGLRRIGCTGAPVQDSVPVSGGASRSLRWQNATNATIATERIEVRSGGCDVDCDAGDAYRLRAYETTAFIPRFNTSGSQLTVLLLQNNSDGLLAGTAWFWGRDGALLGAFSFGLLPHAAQTINASAIPGVLGNSGAVTVSHDGAYGSLTGKAVALEPATGLTFDTALAYRPR